EASARSNKRLANSRRLEYLKPSENNIQDGLSNVISTLPNSRSQKLSASLAGTPASLQSINSFSGKEPPSPRRRSSGETTISEIGFSLTKLSQSFGSSISRAGSTATGSR